MNDNETMRRRIEKCAEEIARDYSDETAADVVAQMDWIIPILRKHFAPDGASQTLTDEEIELLRRLDAEADRGPWGVRYNGLRAFKAYGSRREVWPLSCEGEVADSDLRRLRANANLIVAMRNLLPRLLERESATEDRR